VNYVILSSVLEVSPACSCCIQSMQIPNRCLACPSASCKRRMRLRTARGRVVLASTIAAGCREVVDKRFAQAWRNTMDVTRQA